MGCSQDSCEGACLRLIQFDGRISQTLARIVLYSGTHSGAQTATVRHVFDPAEVEQ